MLILVRSTPPSSESNIKTLLYTFEDSTSSWFDPCYTSSTPCQASALYVWAPLALASAHDSGWPLFLSDNAPSSFPKNMLYLLYQNNFGFSAFELFFCIDKYLASGALTLTLTPSYAAPPGSGRRASGLRCWRRGLATGGLAERASSVQWRSADVVEYKAEKSSPNQASRKTKKHDAHESWINWWENSCSLILHC